MEEMEEKTKCQTFKRTKSQLIFKFKWVNFGHTAIIETYNKASSLAKDPINKTLFTQFLVGSRQV